MRATRRRRRLSSIQDGPIRTRLLSGSKIAERQMRDVTPARLRRVKGACPKN
jgi:hypothetical protein